jgi:hypothetical protein
METSVILPPRLSTALWTATRARRFVRLMTSNPKWRGTYDQNIRILNAAYNLFTATENDDVRLFMWKVNPIPFARRLGLQPAQIKRFMAGSWPVLNYRMIHSKCAHCRKLAI